MSLRAILGFAARHSVSGVALLKKSPRFVGMLHFLFVAGSQFDQTASFICLQRPAANIRFKSLGKLHLSPIISYPNSLPQ